MIGRMSTQDIEVFVEAVDAEGVTC